MDKDLADLVKQLTNLDPWKRIGLKNMQVIKKHPFFENVDFEKISKR